ncbi:CRP-like cAMP-binding protein [Desulfobaculum xiamenense]|uniref:CRP-like cAMP-binding protein n=1 Tax=Desulfobaculum xiamenense TaxID=995050 RepID=A0A846QL00_9BACT|nr:cyclic nucleotide-binding domain-containing protein [Desulfobaculum xiamenense]NJB67857.1 CRP-like cAMP-binding protein [Desulfobaculum xiamenense]
MDLNSSTKYKTLHKGQIIFKEGQKGSVAYMLKKGTATVFRTQNNKRLVLARILPGQVFGEEGLFTAGPRNASAVAEEPCELIVIDQDVFRTMLLKCPGPIQRLMRSLVEQVHGMQGRLAESVTSNVLTSVCGVLELMHRALCATERTNGSRHGVSYAELSRQCKDILLVSQLEIDEILARLGKLKIVEITDVREPVMKRDALGRMRRQSDFLKDRYVAIPEPDKFMTVVRNLSQEMGGARPPFTECLEFVDVYDFAKSVGADPEIIYRKMGYKEIPETYFFFHKPTVDEWAKEMGEEFFKRVKRKRVNVDELETVDDIVHVDNTTLQEAFSRIGYHKMALLAAMAGEEARGKIFGNLSKKIAAIVRDESGSMEGVEEMEAADAEDELMEIIRDIKGSTK